MKVSIAAVALLCLGVHFASCQLDPAGTPGQLFANAHWTSVCCTDSNLGLPEGWGLQESTYFSGSSTGGTYVTTSFAYSDGNCSDPINNLQWSYTRTGSYQIPASQGDITFELNQGYVTKTLEISKNRGVLYFNDVCPDATNVIGDDTWSRGVYDVFSFNCSNVFQGCPGTQASYTSIRVLNINQIQFSTVSPINGSCTPDDRSRDFSPCFYRRYLSSSSSSLTTSMAVLAATVALVSSLM